jgi:hypothetical protein
MRPFLATPPPPSLPATVALIKKKIKFSSSKEIQSGAVAKSYMRKGFLMRKYVPDEEAVSNI